MVHVARAAIEAARVDAELIDVRTLVPLDLATITTSVAKTGRCVVVHEAPRTSGFGAELVALVQQHCFWSLEAPIVRVTGWDTPLPHAQEWQYMPSRERIVHAVRETIAA
jgi:2-oxoisovalerate dehydrogenase E1 component beta subunit